MTMGIGKSGYRNRVLLDLMASPWVLGPAALGATSFIAGWAVGSESGLFLLGGLAGLLVGAGTIATRWVTSGDRIADKAIADLKAEQEQKRLDALAQLDQRLAADGDQGTNDLLRAVHELERRLGELEQTEDIDRRPPVEVSSQLRELMRMSIGSLERAAELYETMTRLITDDARNDVARMRSSVLGEVRASVNQIMVTLDGLHTLHLERRKPEAKLAQMRAELDASLNVAKRVEKRVVEFEREIEDGGSSAEVRLDDLPPTN